MNEWVPVISAFVGALVAGFLSYRAAAIRLSKEETAEKRAIILQKLEETHQVVRSIRQSYRESIVHMIRFLLVNQSESSASVPIEIDRLQMLVGFYFPSILSLVEVLETEQHRFGSVIAESIVAATKPNAARQALADSVVQQGNKIDAACNELMKAVTLLARDHFKL